MNTGRRLPSIAWSAGAICAAIMIWLGAESDDLRHAFVFSGWKGDYYSRLVAGLSRGHLYMEADADPGLASPDPLVRERAPTLLDSNYYKGHFYLYYGVVPAVLLLLPYHLLTGQDMGINIACLLFWLLGFGASLFWLRNWWGDTERARGNLLATLLVGILAFFPATTFLVRRSMFYELPLVSGFACLSIFFAALYEIVRRRRVYSMLLVASGSLGLAVGCHPNHVFLLPLLVFVAFRTARIDVAAGLGWGTTAATALLPMAVVGAGLAWYNYARFGDIFEFGFKYGQNGFFSIKQSVFAPRFLWVNLKWYFLTPPALTPYFPFIYPGNNSFRPAGYAGAEAMHGQLPTTLTTVWIALGALVFGVWRRDSIAPKPFLAGLGYAALTALLFIGFLQIRANRYMVDIETPLAWLIAAGSCWIWINVPSGVFSLIWKAGLAMLVFAASAFYILAAVQQFEQFRNTRPAAYSALSRALNVPYRWLYAAGMGPSGALEMRVHFLPQTDEVIEPLVTTGTPGYSDSVYVAQYPNHLVQFRFNHKGYGGPVSPYLSVDLGREHLIAISMGSFYPPAGDSYFNPMDRDSAHLLKKLTYIQLDGNVIMSTTMACYEAPPWSRQVGRNDLTLTEFRRAFGGAISGHRSIPVVPFLHIVDRTAKWGIFRFKIEFPARAPLSGLPLLGVGRKGDGNLVFAKALHGAVYRIDVDDWSYGTLVGKSFTATPGAHDLDIVLGPLLAKGGVPPSWSGAEALSVLANRIVVSLDGTTLGNFKLTHHLNQVDTLTPGSNPQGFSTAESGFGGAFSSFPMNDMEVQRLLDQAILTSRP